MDKRVKYSIKQKEKVVRSILSGQRSITGASNELGCMRSAIKRWIEQYNRHGVTGFKLNNGNYDSWFKLQVVHYYLKKGVSLNQTASYFKIPNEGIISQWVRIYKQSGALWLSPRPRGRKRTSMAQKSKKKINPPTDPITEKLAALQKENDYLRAENAFLKKLEALVQEEEAAKAQARRQKPSGN
jgi:transposase